MHPPLLPINDCQVRFQQKVGVGSSVALAQDVREDTTVFVEVAASDPDETRLGDQIRADDAHCPFELMNTASSVLS